MPENLIAPAPSGAALSAVSSPAGETSTEQTPLNNAFGDLDKLFGSAGQSLPEETKTEEKPRTAPPPVDKPEAKKEVAPPKPEQKPEVKPIAEPKTTPELRKAYDAKKKRLDAVEAELKALKEEKQKQTSVSEHPEFKSLKERYESVEKRAAELAEKIRFSAYEQSDEYKESGFG